MFPSHDRGAERKNQAAINDLGSLYHESVASLSARDAELNNLKQQLRRERSDANQNSCLEKSLALHDGSGSAIAPHYRLFNEAIRHSSLPASTDTQEPDGEADGLDAISYSVREYNALAVRLLVLQNAVRKLPCVPER